MSISRSRSLTMTIELNVINHLGLNMYTTLPAVISEQVANGWDADTNFVDVTLDDSEIVEDATISIVDRGGIGMSFEEVQEKYLRVGRKKREEEGTDYSPGGRRVMGRKGIGKLSAFGIARQLEIRSVKEGKVTHFLMDFDEMLATPKGEDYSPKLLKEDTEPTGDDGESVNELNGTRVTLRRLKRKHPLSRSIPAIRQGLARRFSVIGEDFVVKVNGEPITPQERNLEDRCEHVWTVGKPPLENVEINPDEGWRVSGWIGTLKEPVPREIGAGIVLMARGKLIHEPSFYDVGRMTGEHSLAYMVGEVHADFLDEDEDLIATTRNSVVWESEQGEYLKDWLQQAIKAMASDWVERRIQDRFRAVVGEKEDLNSFVAHLVSAKEQEIAKSLIGSIIKKESLDPIVAKDLCQYVVESIEYRSFMALAQELRDLPDDTTATFLSLLRDWQFIEAREIFRILTGRVVAINTLVGMIKDDFKEKQLHGFLEENPWIIDPSWTVAASEMYLTTFIREEFPDVDEETRESRRFDLVCIDAVGEYHVVEFKRPKVTIGHEEMTQVEKYMDAIEEKQGEMPGKLYRPIRGYLVYGGKRRRGVTKRTLEGRSRIRFLTYDQLVDNAVQLHHQFLTELERLSENRPVLQKLIEVHKSLTEERD